MSNTHNQYIPQNSLPEQFSHLFSQLDPQQVEQFYQTYQYWQLQQQRATLQTLLETLNQQIIDNNVLMQRVQPSTISLANLTRLQSYGVEDVDLLDTLLSRGDAWLDHTLQLLEHCERLDFIHDNYTEWCRHALEGAYDWIDSINETRPSGPLPEPEIQDLSTETTEELLLQKLMSEDETSTSTALKLTDNTPPLTEETLSPHHPATTQLTTPPHHSVEARFIAPSPDLLGASSVEARFIAPPPDLSGETIPEKQIPQTTSQKSPETKTQKSSKPGIVSRFLARAWKP